MVFFLIIMSFMEVDFYWENLFNCFCTVININKELLSSHFMLWVRGRSVWSPLSDQDKHLVQRAFLQFFCMRLSQHVFLWSPAAAYALMLKLCINFDGSKSIGPNLSSISHMKQAYCQPLTLHWPSAQSPADYHILYCCEPCGPTSATNRKRSLGNQSS